jgi:hypothetical protein
MQSPRFALRAALMVLLVPAAVLGQPPVNPTPPTVLDSDFVVPPPDRPTPAENPPTRDPSALLAGGPFGGFDPRMLAMYRADYKATWFSTEHTSVPGTHLGYIEQDLSLSLPLYHECGDILALSLRARNETFDTNAPLPRGERHFPEDLWAVSLGGTFAHTFDNGWIAGGGVSVGSPSDEPFHSIREMAIAVNTFLRIPSGERNAWLFGVTYSPTNEITFPIPTIAYIFNPSDDLRVNVGLPFQVMYRPVPELQLDLSYMLLRTVHARATYRLCQPIRVHVGFDWGNESFFLADRANINDRLFYYDKRVSGGVQYIVTPNCSVDLVGGWDFDRFWFEGAQYADHLSNELSIGNGAFLSLQGRLRW